MVGILFVGCAGLFLGLVVSYFATSAGHREIDRVAAQIASAGSDIEERKLAVEIRRLATERSWPKMYGAAALAAVVTGLVTGMTIWQSSEAEKGRRDDTHRSQQQQDSTWTLQALEFYVLHPDEFDLSKSPQAGHRMVALLRVAPAEMAPIFQSLFDQPGGRGFSVQPVDRIPALADAVRGIQGAFADLDSNANAAVTGLGADLLPAIGRAVTVYIQYGSGSVNFATGLQKRLLGKGYRVPDLEMVAQAPQITAEVRYYRDSQRPVADWLASELTDQSPRRLGAKAQRFGDGGLPDGILEVWIPAGWD